MIHENHVIGKCISILYRQAQAYLAARMKAYEVGSGQYSYLLVLYEHDGISQEELSNRLMIDKGTTARAISKLEGAGYVTRTTNELDRRSNLVYLTEKGRTLQPVLKETLNAWIEMTLSDLKPDERETLGGLLERMVRSTLP